MARFEADRRTCDMASRVQKDARQALAYGLEETPSFAVTGPRGTRLLAGGVPDSIHPFEDAIRVVS